MKFLIVTGLSGSGKTLAVHALEDSGYFCIDNIPFDLIESFYQLCLETKRSRNYAAVVDTRSLTSFGDGVSIDTQKLVSLKSDNIKIIFLEASDDALIRRFKETRRRHPLIGDTVKSIAHAISSERIILSEMRNSADYIVDTTQLSPTQLKERIRSLFGNKDTDVMSVLLQSFGFKYGLPTDTDIVLDVRCLPNPHYIDAFRPLTGTDEQVFKYVFSFEEARCLYDKILDLISYLTPLYVKEGRSHLSISIGCTGGRHRSVAFVERMKGDLAKLSTAASISHRDILR
jgi:UPF0042 nucleotide-binding protein